MVPNVLTSLTSLAHLVHIWFPIRATILETGQGSRFFHEDSVPHLAGFRSSPGATVQFGPPAHNALQRHPSLQEVTDMHSPSYISTTPKQQLRLHLHRCRDSGAAAQAEASELTLGPDSRLAISPPHCCLNWK